MLPRFLGVCGTVANRYGDIITSVTVYPNWGGYDEAALIAAYLKVAK